MTKLQSRNHGLDLLRVLACYMVLQVHAGEFYYIADGGLVAAGGEPVWACWLNSLCRTAVPLFVMLSGFFLLPVRERTRDFSPGVSCALWCRFWCGACSTQSTSS